MKALVGAFNQEKALVGAFSVIVKSSGTFGEPSFQALVDTGHWALPHTGHPNIAVTWPQLQNNVASYFIFIRLQYLDGMGSLHAHNQLLTISHYFR